MCTQTYAERCSQTDRLPAGKLAKWRGGSDVGVRAAQALQLWRDASGLKHVSHLSPFSLAPKLSLRA